MEGFETYVNRVFNNYDSIDKVSRVYGTTKHGSHFVLLKLKKMCYDIYVIMEPDVDNNGHYIHSDSVVSCKKFFFQSDADFYIKCKKYELEAEQKFLCPQFDNYLDQTIKNVASSELYRIRDIDEHGRLFAFVHLKKTMHHSVLLIKEPQKDDNGSYKDNKVLSKKKFRKYHLASMFIQKQRNNQKGITHNVEDDDSLTVLSDIVSNKALEAVYDNNAMDAISTEIPVAVNGASGVVSGSDNDATGHASVIDSLRRNAFNTFVEKSVAKAFRGEEVYRKYGITEAGQCFAFIVSKIECYVIRVVLEPDERYMLWADDAVEYYSHTFVLCDIKKRLIVDAWVAENVKLLIDKSEAVLHRWPIDSCQICISEGWKFIPDLVLKRGDHIQRYLRVGRLKPTYHDGIYLGNGQVAHFTTSANTTFFKSKGGSGGGVVTLEEFAKGENDIFIVCYRCPDRSPEEVAQLAEKLVSSQIWNKQYNLAYKNCQNFASLCAVRKYENIPTAVEWKKVVYQYIPLLILSLATSVALPEGIPIIVAAVPAVAFYVVHKQRVKARKQAQNGITVV